jgi:hypothetical protein
MSEITASILALLVLTVAGAIVSATSTRPGVIAVADTFLQVLLSAGAAMVAVVCVAEAVLGR